MFSNNYILTDTEQQQHLSGVVFLLSNIQSPFSLVFIGTNSKKISDFLDAKCSTMFTNYSPSVCLSFDTRLTVKLGSVKPNNQLKDTKTSPNRERSCHSNSLWFSCFKQNFKFTSKNWILVSLIQKLQKCLRTRLEFPLRNNSGLQLCL